MTNEADRDQNLKFRPNRTFICSVVFIDIVGYSIKSVNEQIQCKERFNALLSDSIRDISVNDRIILDTGDGAAVGFLGDPEDALFVAMSLRDALRESSSEAEPDLEVRMGINLGPVKLLKDINQQWNLIGDGINVAQRIMNFAEPGELLVSRSYYDIVSCLSQEYAKLFHYQGARADKHIREHDIYAVESTGLKPAPDLHDRVNRPEGRVVDADAVIPAKPPLSEPARGTGGRRNLLLIGGAVTALIIVFGLFLYGDKAPRVGSQAIPAGKTDPERETFKALSARADETLFTWTGVQSSGSDTTCVVRIHNRSGEARSVALYDDAFRWKKSQITDGGGKRHDVNRVIFTRASRRTAMSALGTEGIPIGPRESVTAYMTFKRTGQGVRALTLHPFIYQGRWRWKEYDLTLPLGT